MGVVGALSVPLVAAKCVIPVAGAGAGADAGAGAGAGAVVDE